MHFIPIRHSSYKPLYQILPSNTIRLLRIVPEAAQGEALYQLLEVPRHSKSKPHTAEWKQRRYVVLTPSSTSTYDSSSNTNSNASASSETKNSSVEVRAEQELDLVPLPILALGGGEHIIEVPAALRLGLQMLSSDLRKYCPSASPGLSASSATDGANKTATNESDSDADTDTESNGEVYVWAAEICVDNSSDADVAAQGKLRAKIWDGAERVLGWDLVTGMLSDYKEK